MRSGHGIGIDRTTFRRLARIYRQRWGIGLCAVDAEGRVVFAGKDSSARQDQAGLVRRQAIDEALRWGEPEVQPGPGGTLVWAVPLLCNAKVLGGLVAGISEKRLFPGGLGKAAVDVRAALSDLRRLAEEHNLTNAALLESRRHHSQVQRERAEAIHAFKQTAQYDLHSAYLLDEPRLIAAIRKGDRGQAREILNHLLVGMIHRAGDRIDLVKSFFMELVVTLCRAAVEAGGAAEELLGTNFAAIAELSRITTDEALAPWLHQMLERIMDTIQRQSKQTHPAMLSLALQYMAERCCQDVSRDDAAQAACMSPSHFSRFFKKYTGQSFTTVLNQLRIDRAADLLGNSDKDLKLIAQETGFSDQSYFTKVFRKFRRMTPAEYRREQR